MRLLSRRATGLVVWATGPTAVPVVRCLVVVPRARMAKRASGRPAGCLGRALLPVGVHRPPCLASSRSIDTKHRGASPVGTSAGQMPATSRAAEENWSPNQSTCQPAFFRCRCFVLTKQKRPSEHCSEGLWVFTRTPVERRAGFEPATVGICSPFPWAARAPTQKQLW